MKRILPMLAAVMCSALTASAAQKRVLVSSAEEFINSLGSNREIVVCSSDMNLTPTLKQMIADGKLKKIDRWSRAKQEGLLYEEDFDGPQLVLSGLKNLTIRSNSADRANIVVTPRYVNVLTFISCENITLNTLYLGHTEEGYCSNGVLGFDDCHNVTINNCGLFGCGTEGIELRQSENFTMTESEIFHCSYFIMHVLGSKNCTFKNCAFYNNKEFEQVTVDANSENILFDHCAFTKNQGPLFNFEDSHKVVLNRCVIQHNGDQLGRGDERYENCILAID